jgi:hypothetical protein
MSNDLQVPVDFERLHEFRLLVKLLGEKCRTGVAAATPYQLDAPYPHKMVEAMAVFLFMRLWCDLAYLARTTNRPGYLTAQGKSLFEGSLDPLFGSDTSAVELLVQANLLQPHPPHPQPLSNRIGEGSNNEYYCPRFAQMNPHFAGDYVKKEDRGNKKSIIVRQARHVAQAAIEQASLLPPEVFKDKSGQPLGHTEVNRAMVVIKTLDNCYGFSRANKAQYTESLIADAHEVARTYANRSERLLDIYAWILSHRGSPVIPPTTERMLAEFETYAAVAP